LSDATEDQIRDFEDNLRKLKRRASADLQQNVMQNRTQFIKISKEAEKLKGEMRALKSLMADLKTNTSALRTASVNNNSDPANMGGELASSLSKRDRRSSVADRSALWNSQMQVCFLLTTNIYQGI
jgi:exocyst complex component 8